MTANNETEGNQWLSATTIMNHQKVSITPVDSSCTSMVRVPHIHTPVLITGPGQVATVASQPLQDSQRSSRRWSCYLWRIPSPHSFAPCALLAPFWPSHGLLASSGHRRRRSQDVERKEGWMDSRMFDHSEPWNPMVSRYNTTN